MLVIVGIILLLLWLLDYAVHLTAGSLVDLLLLFAVISFALDFMRGRGSSDRRPGWDHRPTRGQRRGAKPEQPKAAGDGAEATREQA